MNIQMNGKKILRAEVIMADGNPYGLKADAITHWYVLGDQIITGLHLSATYHGDHDEFWIIVEGEKGAEIARFNCRNQVTGIIWAPDSEATTAIPDNNATDMPMQPLAKDSDGTLRFKENGIVNYLLNSADTDLNKIAMLNFTNEDRQQFAQLIGYSLSGYGVLSYVTDENYALAEKAGAKVLESAP